VHVVQHEQQGEALGGAPDERGDRVEEVAALLLCRQVERLGPESQKALAAAAVVGRGFPFALLEEITDVGPGLLLDIVEEAEAAMVVVPEDRGGAVHYTFAHELIRQTLLTGLSLLRRQRLHLAVADAIERLYPDARESRPSEVAHHLLQAGAAADPQRTLAYLEAAVERAMASAAFEEALRAAGDALSILGPEDVLRRARIKEQQGLAARALGRYDECLAIWDDVVTDYAELGETEVAAELCWEMGYLLVWLSRFADAFELYERGLKILGESRGPATAALVGSVGLLIGFSGAAGMHETSLLQLTEAEDIARECGDERNQGRVNWARCVVEWSYGHVPQAVAAGETGVQHLRRAGDLWTLTDALAWVAFPMGMDGRLVEGAEAADEALDLAVRLGHVGGEIIARRGALLNEVPRAGDLDALERALRKDLELCLSIRSPWSSQSHAWLSFVATLQGRYDEGLALAEESMAIEPESSWSGIGWASRLANRAHAGDHAEVRRMVDEQEEALRALGSPATMGAMIMQSVAGESAAVAGLADVCAELYPALADHPDQFAFRPFDWALTHRVAGMAAAGAGRWDDAEQHLREALAQAESLPNLLEVPRVRHAYGEMLLRRGAPADRGRAHELLGAARDGYRAMGMPVRAHAVEEQLGQG
jgi:tetratricopeptide (TPR) repeat protein